MSRRARGRVSSRRLPRSGALALCAAFALACTALPVGEPGCRRAAAELVEISGVGAQLDLVGPLFRDQLERTQAADPRVVALLAQIYAESYAPAGLRRAVAEGLERRCDVARMEETLAWLRTPEVQHLVSLDVAASTPEANRTIEAHAARLVEASQHDPRLRLVQRLDVATHASELGLELALQPHLATALAFDSTLAPSVRSGPERVRATLEQQFAPQLPGIRRFSWASLLYTYATVSEAELAAYVEWNESPTGRWYNRQMTESMKDAFLTASHQTVTRIDESLRAK